MSGRLVVPESYRRTPSRRSVTAVVATLALLASSGCDSPTETGESVLGKIELTAMSEGEGSLPDSFVVLLNGATAGTMGSNDTYTIPFLPPNQYVVALQEESENCWFGLNARTITVEAKETTPITFLVRCK